MKKSNFLPFKEAREIVRKLGLKSYKEWQDLCSKNRIANIPIAPDLTYKEWNSWYDWLGKSRIYKNKFLPFTEAREFARKLKLKGRNYWVEFCKLGLRPSNIPSSPNVVYKEWDSWGDWLGTNNKAYGRRYETNENYFKKWSHNMAYVLGLWFSDGCIYDNRFDITLHKNDEYLLKLILKDMQSNCRLINHHNCYRLAITSTKIVDSIKKLGGIPHKSLTIKFPKIPKKYLPDFIRGLWDGDGTVYLSKITNYATASIDSGSKCFIYSLRRTLKSLLPGFTAGIYCRIRKKGTRSGASTLKKDSVTYSLHVGPGNTIRLGELLYARKDCLKMERKFQKFMMGKRVQVSNSDKYKDAPSYREARRFLKKLKFKSEKDWKNYCKSDKKPENIPSCPIVIIKNSGMDFLNF